MSLIVTALAGALLVPAAPASAPVERPLMLALNPQPEPPGRGKIKRIYSGGPDSRRGKTIKQTPAKTQVAPTKY